jgi:hypothetical protein
MLQFLLRPVNLTVGNPGTERQVPHDISIYGIQVVNFQTDSHTLEPLIKIYMNNELVVGHPDGMPAAPFVKPYFFSDALFAPAGSKMRLEVLMPNLLTNAGFGNVATPFPNVYVFYRELDKEKSSRKNLRWVRVNNTTVNVPITFSSQYATRLRSMFTWTDAITGGGANINSLGLINYPSIITAPLITAVDTRNLWSIKREDLTPGVGGFYDDLVDQGYHDLWRWGYFSRSVLAGASPLFAGSSMPDVMRYRFNAALYIGPDKQLVMQRPWTWTPAAPAVAADAFTNFVFEYDEVR